MYFKCVLIFLFVNFLNVLSKMNIPVGTIYKACEIGSVFEDMLNLTKIDKVPTWQGYNGFRYALNGNTFYLYPGKDNVVNKFDISLASNSQVPLITEMFIDGCKFCFIKNNGTIYTLDADAVIFGDEEEEINEIEVTTTPKTPEDITQHFCGIRRVNYQNLVFDGNIAEAGQWPWHVALFIKRDEIYTYRCGGSIINFITILTAGHCISKQNKVYNARKFIVYAGVVDLTEKNCSECQQFQVLAIARYPYYNQHNNFGDIALLKLDKPIVWTNYVQPICLPSFDAIKADMIEKYGIVAGFGRTKSGRMSDEFRYTDVQIVSDSTCLASDIFYNSVLHEFNFCAGNGPTSDSTPGPGDSGGGLVLPTKAVNGVIFWTIRGIISRSRAGEHITDPSAYVIYTDVASYKSWIVQTLYRFNIKQ